MSESGCPGCGERDAIIEALRRRVDELERLVKDLQARLGLNASNSSLPPSANPPAAHPPVVEELTVRKSGVQPGHEGHQRLRPAPGRVQHAIALDPLPRGRPRPAACATVPGRPRGGPASVR